MENAFSMIVVTALVLTFGTGCVVQRREVTFSPKPYVERYNAKVGLQYDVIKDTVAKEEATKIGKLKKGRHKLIVKGREGGARLEKIFIGKAGTTPGEGPGQTIKIEDGAIVAPMRIRTINGVKSLVGSKDAGEAVYRFDIDADGDYAIWGKAAGPDEESNSFFVALDDCPEMIWGVPATPGGKTKWTKVKGRGLEYCYPWCFQLTWGATSPLSERRDDQELRKTAMELTNKKLDKMVEQSRKQSLWFIHDLETVRMWQQDLRTPRSVVSGLLKKLRPFVDNCQIRAMKKNTWCDNAPNILLQEAAILRLASVMWRSQDPRAARLWADTSEKRLTRALTMKMHGGAFSYSYSSGVDAAYFGYDGKFLTRYYQLTGDKRARDALADMAIAAETSTIHGRPISLGSPWWKHLYGAYDNGSAVPEMVLVASKNPSYARLVELARQRLFSTSSMSKPYDAYDGEIGVYYNMLSPEFSAPVAPLKDKCFFSKLENGPALRYGPLNIAMPWRSWSETTCGATWSTPDAVESEVCSVILTALIKNTEGKLVKARYPIAYSVVEHLNPEPDTRTVIVGEDFIASATSFRPALGGPATPSFAYKENQSPWLRTDIYFADKNGFAGSLELSALRDNDCSEVALWVHVSDNQKVDDNKIKLDGLMVELEKKYAGKLTNSGKIWGSPVRLYPIELLEATVKKAEPDGFKKGETFRSKVAVNVDNSLGLSVGIHEVKDGLHTVEILVGGEKRALLTFNNSNHAKFRIWDKRYGTAMQSTSKGSTKSLPNGERLELPPGSLTILLNQFYCASKFALEGYSEGLRKQANLMRKRRLQDQDVER